MLLLICLAFVGLCAGQGLNQTNLTDIFEQTIDTNNNTILDLPEFKAIVLQDDLNKDGEVSLAEYQRLGGMGKGPAAFFALVDPNSDGVVDDSELPVILSSFDLNGDGKVTALEFIKKYSELYYKAFGIPVSIGK
ncbi:uncharacterized protein LOC124290851 isoform X2 [Haliotis rubra]|uniref:uncharacterized protein LOC124290851 isoform X2 n=1 Tax=Haliotis rubra TaxID=36100 RepID=UPI001EE5F7BA|nr:uncharacterized protein LOC124290851 isoform X2 [Haliotis rubra]XP_046583654.1 uncharacterized protein LOC124290851 isoform X2 [Haliotis rubra]XP_046583655.1 uncharacterized protein LOC124290851 isoform X2 [Haliotis rubra]